MATKHIDSPDFEPESPDEIFSDTIYTPESPEIQVVKGSKRSTKGDAGLSDQARELLFNEEFVEVMLHESSNPNDENPVFTSCNFVTQYFFRGQIQSVRRKYVAILASCKEHAISTPEFTQGDGSRAMSIQRRSALKYPFSVIHDPNPRGPAWLKALLHSPT